jgi:1-phosphatidylinositol-4-phosphate 5-kinase
MGIVGHISLTDTIEDENYPQGLVLVPRGTDDDSVVVGPHIRGSRLRASSAGDEEVDLLLPGTARYGIQPHPIILVRSSTGACIFLSTMPKVLVKLFRAVALDIL